MRTASAHLASEELKHCVDYRHGLLKTYICASARPTQLEPAFKMLMGGAGDGIAQLAKHLPHKHEVLSVIPEPT